MSRLVKLALSVVAALIVFAPLGAAGPPDHAKIGAAALERAQGAPGEMVDLILMYHTPPGGQDRADVETRGGQVKHRFVTIPGHAVRVPARALQGLAHNPNVARISLDARLSSQADTSVNGVRTTVDTSFADGLGLTGAGVTVAVLDSGVESHPDLAISQQVDIIPPYVECGHADARVQKGLVALYSFNAGQGSVVQDLSGAGVPLDLSGENAERLTWGDEGLTLNASTRVSNPTDSNKIFTEVTASHAITVEAWLEPGNTTQDGPARIATLSLDPYNRNFTLGTREGQYIFRLRTTSNGTNGMNQELRSPSGSLTASRQHVVFTRDAAGNAALYVDGVLADSAALGGDLSNWNPSYDLGLGNEFSTGSTTTARDWVGRLEMLAISSEALTAADVLQNYQAGSDKAGAGECVAPTPVADGWGHGTHVSGIIAANGAGSGSSWAGMAPGAGIISVRVLDQTGTGNASDVIAGLDWIYQNKDQYGIRVANVSLGHPVYESVSTDPLVQAVEFLWDAGVVVVCSAGNSGANGYGTVSSPGSSPKVITVGSLTHWGTADPSDDSISSFSSRGPTLLDHFVKPDLVAPGNRIVSVGAGNSGLHTILPERAVAAQGQSKKEYFILSGTSMSAAVVSGTVALMLEKESTLDPDTVKARLMRSATKVDAGDPFMTGAGVLNPTAALQESGTLSVPALSPAAYRDEAGVRIGFDNTGVSWGDPNYAQSLIWGDSLVWSDSVVWGDSIVWGDSLVWSDSVVWGEGTVFSDSLVWSDSIVWGESLVWSDSVVWGESVVWSDSLVWSDGIAGQSAIWGE